jgi:hypothetical protein
MSKNISSQNAFRIQIKKAIERKDISYLKGVLSVEKRIGKKERVKWLENRIKEIEKVLYERT